MVPVGNDKKEVSTEEHGRTLEVDLGNTVGQPDSGARSLGKETCIAGLRRQGAMCQDPAGGW